MSRARKHDETDPEAASSASGIREREENRNIADDTKSQATTERDGLKFERKAKKEHPNAPEPVIGMNDERAEVSFCFVMWVHVGVASLMGFSYRKDIDLVSTSYWNNALVFGSFRNCFIIRLIHTICTVRMQNDKVIGQL